MYKANSIIPKMWDMTGLGYLVYGVRFFPLLMHSCAFMYIIPLK